MTGREIAEALSAGNYEKVADKPADNIEWNMYKESALSKANKR